MTEELTRKEKLRVYNQARYRKNRESVIAKVKARQARHSELGLCTSCNEVATSKRYCDKHLKASLAKLKLLTSKYKKQGLCIACGGVRVNRYHCQYHYEKHKLLIAARSNRWRASGCCQSCGRKLEPDIDTKGVCITCKEKHLFRKRIKSGCVL